MSITPKFNAIIKNGRPVLYNKDVFYEYCQGIDGKDVEIIVRRKYSKKSNNQNRYYRGVVVKLIADECGYEPKRAHGELQLRFFLVQPDDGSVPYIRSTRLDEWSTSEWEEKMEEIRRWASEFLSLYIPMPNEVDY